MKERCVCVCVFLKKRVCIFFKKNICVYFLWKNVDVFFETRFFRGKWQMSASNERPPSPRGAARAPPQFTAVAKALAKGWDVPAPRAKADFGASGLRLVQRMAEARAMLTGPQAVDRPLSKAGTLRGGGCSVQLGGGGKVPGFPKVFIP